LRTAKKGSLGIDIRGNGTAVKQRPKPGSALPEKGPVVVWFR
jgi:hypothetical protein